MEKTAVSQSSQQKFEIVNIEDDDDAFGFKPISLKRSRKSTAISVNQLDEERDLQSIKAGKFIDLTEETLSDDDEEIRILRFKPLNTPFGKRKKPFTNWQSSNSKNDPSFVCEICVEPKCSNELFKVENCSHAYCTDCVVKYVASKLQDNITMIGCPVPDCKGLLGPEYCRSVLPPKVYDRWGSALCEAVILGSEKFYCPFKDCSAMLVDDGKEVIMQSECPNCWRMFCAQCKVAWHAGIECAEFQKLNKYEREKEDIMLRNLAQEKQWKRCPSCKYYVERIYGCSYINCRCGCAFCYNCGARSSTSSHVCSRCR